MGLSTWVANAPGVRRRLTWILSVVLAFLCLTGSWNDAGAAGTTSARLWSRATPAAGIPIRSAPGFRAHAVSKSGSILIDIYQLNTDGTSTKLDTLVATPGGTNSAGTYSTRNMAAIYWQFDAIPAASASPPPVTVTFFNDTPAVALSGLYYNPLPQTPFASTDKSLLLNLDLRNGLPAGWTQYGSGSFDSTYGYSPGTAAPSGIANVSVPAFSSASPMPTGTIAIRFQRGGVSTDNSFPPYFWDSSGNTLNATTQNRQLFIMRSNSSKAVIGAAVLAASVPFFQVDIQTPSMQSTYNFGWQTLNSHYVAGYQDPTFAELVITWYQNQYYFFFDGHLVSAGTLGDIPTYQMLQNICIGNYNGGGLPSNAPFGAFAIQRFQVSTRFLGPVFAGPTVGLLGDSFVQGYTLRANPTASGSGGALQITDIDAVQNALGMYDGMTALLVQPGQTAAFHQIQALMFQNYGFFPPVYDAGQSGHGYSSINQPIDDAFVAALNLADPAVVFIEGSVNDVSPFKPSDANLLADTKTFLNRLRAGGGSRISAMPNAALESIVYLEMLSSQGVPSGGGYPEPAYGTESQNLIGITRAGLANFAPPNAVRFSYVTSREWWNEDPNYAYYLYGTNPANPMNAYGGRDYQNVHPDPAGYSVIAAHLYPLIANAIMTTAGADLSLAGTGGNNAGLATYTLSIADAGPLASTGGTLTATVPGGTTLVVDASTSGCVLNGQALTCPFGSIAAGNSATVNVALKLAASASANITFSLSGGATYDPNAANNSVTIAVAPAASGTTDGPLPLWALAALALSLFGIASRKLKNVA